MTAATLLDLLAAWVGLGWLRPVDRALARFLHDECPDAHPLLLLAAALASHQLGRGHACLDLRATLADPWMALSLPPESAAAEAAGAPPVLPAEVLSGISLNDWRAALQHAELTADGPGQTPLVLAGDRLYLRRYWQCERTIETVIGRLLARPDGKSADPGSDGFRQRLAELFPPAPAAGEPDWQKIACALAARSAFSIITGGPGTGKTTTVVRLLALLQGTALATDPARPLRIRLAAPTGKAAARLRESIAGALEQLPADLGAAIPAAVTTLHRLLGSRPGSRRFRHDARDRLDLDVLVVDEASMIDLEMMAALLAALPDHGRLVLLGDKDQLASVEAGSVLGELCRRAGEGRYTPATAAWIEAACGETIPAALMAPAGAPLDQAIAMLRRSHRFTADSGIGRLAAAVNAGDAAKIAALWQAAPPDIARIDIRDPGATAFAGLVVGDPLAANDHPAGYAAYLTALSAGRPGPGADGEELAAWAGRVLSAHARFQVLCAVRGGAWGVAAVNERIATALAAAGLLEPGDEWYEGRPVLVTRNDYALGLMNGDIGVTLAVPGAPGDDGRPGTVLRVAFPRDDGSGGIRWILPSRLADVETVFALTVHKAQGSEFEHCALILPGYRSPVLTRELVYTGITRARRWFSLVTGGNPAIVAEAAGRPVQRSGGLFPDLD